MDYKVGDIVIIEYNMRPADPNYFDTYFAVVVPKKFGAFTVVHHNEVVVRIEGYNMVVKVPRNRVRMYKKRTKQNQKRDK